MTERISGIHHITAICSDPRRNIVFYTGFLGLRLVKKTVNFDDPGAYHFYYGDDRGRPGTILTFFVWPGAHAGRRGWGEVSVVHFAVPAGWLDHWHRRCREHEIAVAGPDTRFSNERYLTLFDPDGMQIELVETDQTSEDGRIAGFHGATISLAGYEATASLMSNTLGFEFAGEHEGRFRYRAHGEAPGNLVDLIAHPDTARGLTGAGIVHHIAWRTANDQTQLEWRRQLIELKYDVTPVMDRQYFHSIYFREPGGVLFEIATDPPGFAIDETPDQLGTNLKLPPWLESRRPIIEQILPSLS